jgi:DNA-binding transcriptional LysR family regulator
MEHSKLSLARRLKLQQLSILEQVIERGSIVAASRALNMTQPAVSKSIRETEAHFGRALFTREKRGVRLTEFGQLVARHASSLLAELRLLADDVNAWNSGTSGQVVVGTLISASAKLLPDAIIKLREMAPDVVVRVSVGSNAALYPELAGGKLDLVIGLLPSEDELELCGVTGTSLLHVPLYEEALCVVVGRQHPLASAESVSAEDLKNMDWIVPTPESAAARSMKAFFRHTCLHLPRRKVESLSILTNLALLQSSLMVGLMPRTVAARFASTGQLAVLCLGRPNPFGKVGYTVCSERAPTASAQRMIDALVKVSSPLQ